VRRSFELYVYGYIVTPEHAYLLLSEPRQGSPADALQSLKRAVCGDGSPTRSILGNFNVRK
jgi:hypothetical protein